MSNISEEMMQLVKKNLPEYVGVELKTFIEEANKNKQLLENLRLDFGKQTEELNKAKVELAVVLRDNASLKAKDEEVSLKEKDLTERERLLEITILTQKLEGMTAQRDAIKGLVDVAFRNPAIRQRVYGSVPVPIEGQQANQYNSYGSPGYIGVGAIDKTTETFEY